MMRSVTTPKRFPRREEDRRITEFLKAIQDKLLPDHANEIVAINLETGEYTIGTKAIDVALEYKKRWPSAFAHLARVDGGPVFKFHGLSR